MTKYVMLIDYKFCTGCHTCEVACRKEKGFSEEEWGVRLADEGPVRIGGKWMWNYVPIPSDACDMCIERIEQGKKPACVHHCLSQCMEVVAVGDASTKLASMGSGVAVFAPGDQGFPA